MDFIIELLEIFSLAVVKLADGDEKSKNYVSYCWKPVLHIILAIKWLYHTKIKRI